MNPYEPHHPHLLRVWKRLSEALRASRMTEAQRREKILKAVAGRRSKESERAALKRLGEGMDRSTFRRWQNRYRAFGFDGLLDWRLPPEVAAMPEAVREAICTLRRADRDCPVATIVAHVKQHHGYDVSETKVKAVLREAGLSRRRGPPSGRPQSGEVRLELAGMKLVEAACVQTQYLSALTEAVVAQAGAAIRSRPAAEADASGRDEFGRFRADYNEQYRKQAGDSIGPGFASVDEKRKDKEAERFHLNQVRPEIVERKMWALLSSPLLGSGRWDGIRVPRGELLAELCGFPYMPSTLDLFTRELKFVGVAATLWEVHARLWLAQTKSWGDARTAAVLYIDETNKPVWTELFSESSKVSSVGRVMPSLEVVAFHSGYGVPLWQVTKSGRAPMVREVPALLQQLQQVLGGAEVGRIVVIDAEGNSIPFLKGLETGTPKRAWLTRLRSSWVEGKEIFNRTNYRAYRDGDRIRAGLADFPDPTSPGETFRMRVIEIERRTKGTVTYLGASLLLPEAEWAAGEMADLYFDRWPNQEANFRAVNQAVGAKEVHGYGKQLVDNVSVVTKIDELRHQLVRIDKTIETLEREGAAAARELRAAQALVGRLQRRLDTVTGRIDDAISRGARVTPALQRLSVERKSLGQEITRGTAAVGRKQNALDRRTAKAESTSSRQAERREDLKTLESRRRIFRHDVELDSLFALLKVGLVLLVQFVLKEYLNDARMEPVTFLERLATLPGRLRTMPGLEIVTFEYNRRDPEVMALLEANVEAINARRLRTRSGRLLRIEVEPAPPPRRPPPPGGRVNSGGRFQQ